MSSAWSSLKLSHRFALASFFVLLVSSLLIGYWVTKEIERGVVQNAGATTAAYVETFIAPVVQDLRAEGRLSPESVAIFDKLLDPATAEQRVLSIKLWRRDGSLAYHSDAELVDQTFPISPALQAAFEGQVMVEYDDLLEEENELERASDVPFMEVYNPVWRNTTGEIFVVAEFYVDATNLKAELRDVQMKSWAIVGSVTLVVYGLLFGIVRGGSQTITRQQDLLKLRVAELSLMQDELQVASRRASEINERFLRRVGSELHDGPAQLLGLALLKLDAVRPAEGARETDAFQTVKTSLDDTLTEIRALSAGLVLPAIQNLTPSEIAKKAVDIHERRTGMTIITRIDPIDRTASQAISISIYRFVQEALTNAFRHSGVNEATVTVRCVDSRITIEVRDEGKGFLQSSDDATSEHLGVIGLRERIQSIGGRFELTSAPGEGATVRATLSLDGKPASNLSGHSPSGSRKATSTVPIRS